MPSHGDRPQPSRCAPWPLQAAEVQDTGSPPTWPLGPGYRRPPWSWNLGPADLFAEGLYSPYWQKPGAPALFRRPRCPLVQRRDEAGQNWLPRDAYPRQLLKLLKSEPGFEPVHLKCGPPHRAASDQGKPKKQKKNLKETGPQRGQEAVSIWGNWFRGKNKNRQASVVAHVLTP